MPIGSGVPGFEKKDKSRLNLSFKGSEGRFFFVFICDPCVVRFPGSV